MATEDFDEFYATAEPRLVGQLHLLTGDREEARDCVNEAFERAWLRWERVSQLQDREGWVRLVARRLAVSRWRKVSGAARAWRRRTERGDQPTSVNDVASGSADRMAVVEALQLLPQDQRVVLVLHHVADRSVVDVAAELGLSESAVKSRLSRGRAALVQLLAMTEIDRGERTAGTNDLKGIPGR